MIEVDLKKQPYNWNDKVKQLLESLDIKIESPTKWSIPNNWIVSIMDDVCIKSYDQKILIHIDDSICVFKN